MTRDEKGRFAKGSSGNLSGRPKSEAAAIMRDALTAELNATRARKIANRLITKAENGDLKATEQLLRFLGLFDDKLELEFKDALSVSIDQ